MIVKVGTIYKDVDTGQFSYGFQERVTLEELNEMSFNMPNRKLAKIREYALKLMDTDYRGNPPAEHYIGRKLIELVEDSDVSR